MGGIVEDFLSNVNHNIIISLIWGLGLLQPYLEKFVKEETVL